MTDSTIKLSNVLINVNLYLTLRENGFSDTFAIECYFLLLYFVVYCLHFHSKKLKNDLKCLKWTMSISGETFTTHRMITLWRNVNRLPGLY